MTEIVGIDFGIRWMPQDISDKAWSIWGQSVVDPERICGRLGVGVCPSMIDPGTMQERSGADPGWMRAATERSCPQVAWATFGFQ